MRLATETGMLRPTSDLFAETALEPLPTLSQREASVLKLLADGRSTTDVARELFYAERTVKLIVQGVVRRFGLRNRTHAVAYAIRHGLI
jgi:DNA-binding NarL/FixJ family response regulator